MDCDEALSELEAYLDGEVAVEIRLRVEEHLGGCSPCMDRAEFRRQLRLIVRRKCGSVAHMPPELGRRIRGALASDDLGTA